VSLGSPTQGCTRTIVTDAAIVARRRAKIEAYGHEEPPSRPAPHYGVARGESTRANCGPTSDAWRTSAVPIRRREETGEVGDLSGVR